MPVPLVLSVPPPSPSYALSARSWMVLVDMTRRWYVRNRKRAVEDREHKRRKTTGEASIQIGGMLTEYGTNGR